MCVRAQPWAYIINENPGLERFCGRDPIQNQALNHYRGRDQGGITYDVRRSYNGLIVRFAAATLKTRVKM
jgi:hypothetical protein